VSATDARLTTGYDDRPITLTDADLALLHDAEARDRLYVSDNEAKWDRLLEVRLLESALPNQIDWYGGWMRISAKGRAILARLADPPASLR
jgi:hypothetical protein